MLDAPLPSVAGAAGPANVVVHCVMPLRDIFSTTAGIIWS